MGKINKSCSRLQARNSVYFTVSLINPILQKQPSRGVSRNRCSKNMQQIYRRHPCRSAISIKFQSNFIEIALRHGCSPVNLLHIFRTPFLKNISGWLPLILTNFWFSRWFSLPADCNNNVTTVIIPIFKPVVFN